MINRIAGVNGGVKAAHAGHIRANKQAQERRKRRDQRSFVRV
jgi:hypothetical protein